LNEVKKNIFELTTLEDYSNESLLKELRRVADVLDGEHLTKKNFIKLSKVHWSTIERRFGTWRNALDLAEISEAIAPKFNSVTRDELITNLQMFAKDHPNTPATLNDIAKRLGVHTNTITGKFGKWIDLLNEAGISPVAHGRRYTDDECYENIVNLWTHYGRQPNFAELNQLPSKVGSKAYISRWGGWRAALSAFVKHINQEVTATDATTITPAPKTEMPLIPTDTNITPRSISLGLRYKVLCRDNFKCVICGRSPAKDPSIELHVDHIFPWSKGGKNTEENLRTLCFDCNLGKGAKIEISP
jgi:transposase